MTQEASEQTQTVSEPLARNIDALMRRRQRDMANQNLTERLAARVATFAGSVWSVVIHALVFGIWILINVGLAPFIPPWDPTLVVLAMIASVEAIFLTTFVLMNQRLQALIDEDRAELTLQISLLAEHETTKLAGVVMAIARQLRVPLPSDVELHDLTQEVSAEGILDEISRKRPG